MTRDRIAAATLAAMIALALTLAVFPPAAAAVVRVVVASTPS
jgi:hypothetical protein